MQFGRGRVCSLGGGVWEGESVQFGRGECAVWETREEKLGRILSAMGGGRERLAVLEAGERGLQQALER